MSALVEKVKALQLPKGEYVVIGSGLLDALGLRASHDLDLAVSDRLFAQLQESAEYEVAHRHGADVLLHDDIEVWRQWKDDLPFSELINHTYEHDGVVFAHPDVIIDRKTLRGLPKDIEDIRLLKEHFHYE